MFTTTLLLIAVSVLQSDAIILNGKCGFPGRPYMSKVDNDFKLTYLEGEEVQYQCMHYWNYIQTRKCVRGRWLGPQAKCGKLNRVFCNKSHIENFHF